MRLGKAREINHIRARNTDLVEQLLEVELGMPRNARRCTNRRMQSADGLPAFFVKMEIKPRQDQRPLLMKGNRLQQIGSGGNGTGRPCGNHRSIMGLDRRELGLEDSVAPFHRINQPQGLEIIRPKAGGGVEEFETDLPKGVVILRHQPFQ